MGQIMHGAESVAMGGYLMGFVTSAFIGVFLAYTFWAWSGNRTADFEAAARTPLEDEG